MEWLNLAQDYGLFVALVAYTLIDGRQRENKYIEREEKYIKREKEYIQIIKSFEGMRTDVKDIKDRLFK